MALQNRENFGSDFNRLAWSNLFLQSAEQIALAAAPIVAVLYLGASIAETGTLQTVLTLPFVLFAIPAGLLADRMERKSLMVWAEALRAASLLALFGLIITDQMTWPLLALLGFIGVCGTVVFSVAAPALVPSLVPGESLGTANARMELARTIAFTAGPALGGVLVGWTGAAFAFACAALLSVVATMSLWKIQEPRRTPGPRRQPLLEIREGFSFISNHALLAPVFLTQFVFSAAMFMILAVFVPHAVHNLGLGAAAVGLTLGMLGFGMLVGALCAGRLMRYVAFGTVVGIGPLSGLAGAMLIATTAWVPSALLAGSGFFLLGVGPILWVISTTTLRQSVTPANLLGRVSAINILAYGARPLGAGLGAFIGDRFGVEACLMAAVLGFALQALIIYLSPAVRLSEQPVAVAIA